MGIVGKAGKFILNRVFGAMTARQCTASALKVGRRLVDAAKSGQKLNTEILHSIFEKSLPKGVKAPSIFTTPEALREMCGSALPTKIGRKVGLSVADASINNGLAAFVSLGKNQDYIFPNIF